MRDWGKGTMEYTRLHDKEGKIVLTSWITWLTERNTCTCTCRQLILKSWKTMTSNQENEWILMYMHFFLPTYVIRSKLSKSYLCIACICVQGGWIICIQWNVFGFFYVLGEFFWKKVLKWSSDEWVQLQTPGQGGLPRRWMNTPWKVSHFIKLTRLQNLNPGEVFCYAQPTDGNMQGSLTKWWARSAKRSCICKPQGRSAVLTSFAHWQIRSVSSVRWSSGRGWSQVLQEPRNWLTKKKKRFGAGLQCSMPANRDMWPCIQEGNTTPHVAGQMMYDRKGWRWNAVGFVSKCFGSHMRKQAGNLSFYGGCCTCGFPSQASITGGGKGEKVMAQIKPKRD